MSEFWTWLRPSTQLASLPSRPMVGLVSQLTSKQLANIMAYKGPENFGDAKYLLKKD